MSQSPTQENKNKMREQRRKLWETQWGDENFNPDWGDRGVSVEIIKSVQTGWLSKQGNVLDIGCGLGNVTAWFAQQGYEALGCDIAEAAINKAKIKYAAIERGLEFMTLDICHTPPPDRQYNIVIDRGCLHQIPSAIIPNYVTNLASVCSQDAKILLFIKAFREGQPFGDPTELRQKLAWVSNVFVGKFRIDSYALANLGRKPITGKSAKILPGIFVRLVRS